MMTTVIPAVSEHCEWQKHIMIGAVVTAVIGVAIAFFSQEIFAGVGFSLLGVTGGIGLWIVQDALDTEKLKKIIAVVASDNKKLEAAKKIEQALAKRYQTETGRLQNIERDLGRQLDDLRNVNQTLLLSKTEIEQASHDLSLRNQALEDNQAVLQQKVADLSHTLDGFKQQVQQFLRSNADLKRIRVGFQGAVHDLHDEEVEIERLDHVFDDNLHDLSVQLAEVRASYEMIVAFISKEKVEMGAQCSHLEEMTAKIQIVEQKLEEKIKQLEAQGAEVRQSGAQLAAVKTELSKVQEQFAATLAKKDTLMAAWEKMMALKGEELKALDAKIQEKSDLLRTLLESLNKGH